MIGRALASGNRVWFVGGIKLPQSSERLRVLPPAPNLMSGWDNVTYMESCREQVGAFVRAHTARGEAVSLPASAPVNN